MHKAFSLIELLIVIVIIGVVYTMAIGNFEQIKDKKIKITLKNLKEYLQDIPHEKEVKFLCLDGCTNCNIFVDNKKIKELENVFDNFLDSSVEIYRYEFSLGAIEKNQHRYFNEQDTQESICFEYSVNKKGVGEDMLVKYKDFVYDFSSYFTSVKIYNSIQDAIDAKENLRKKVLD